MAWWLWVLIAYLAISIFNALWLALALAEILKALKSRKITLSKVPFIFSIIRDSVAWPWYILWYGLSAYLKELRGSRP